MADRCKYRNITIRGVVYATAREASEALGVGPKAIRMAIARGTLETVGLPKAKPVTIQGKRYESIAAAARAFGVTDAAVRIAIKKGTEHRLGTGAVGWEPNPIRIRGVVYASAAEAAEALGVKRSTIYAARERGTLDRVGLGLRRPFLLRSQPVVIGGLSFESKAAASRAIGRHDAYVARVMRMGSAAERERMIAAFMALKAKKDSAAMRRRDRCA
ncbi:NUMOD1 domain-containing DNA-binding protein [Celeribacter sp.]|uniref:NUMOD1 domain-containing DNA-binding protein n=1 Tax=Celeribacter sp. TaxID=1890673 RepID=UPI003A92B41D